MGRMRVSYPALTAARFDPHLKQMFLAELISQSYNDGTQVVVPEGANAKTVTRDTFKRFRDALSGLNQDNVGEVMRKLVELGLAGGYTPQPGHQA